jgi:glycosyltransferase involved in cell wall biosynthesis
MSARKTGAPDGRARLAYLFSRWPVLSQTFVDNEMLALESAGWKLTVAAVNPPVQELRHARLDALRGPVLHNPPSAVRKAMESRWREDGRWPETMVADYAARFGGGDESARRCRNALYFAEMLPWLGVTHVHGHFANQATYSALFLKALSGIGFSLTPQAQDFMVDLRSPDLLREMLAQAEFVIAPCDDAQRELEARCPESAGKVVRIYNGIDPAGYAGVARPAAEGDVLRIISVGRLIEFKGFHHLLAAVARARATGVDVRLDLMGDGPWRGRLEQQSADLGLAACVRFHGSVQLEEMKRGFANADVFALACVRDPAGAGDMLPTVITEAMLSGMPVLSSRMAGIPEQVADGTTGILTEPGDEAALAAALVRLARDPALVRSMGEAGRRQAIGKFAVSVTLPQLEDRFRACPAAGPQGWEGAMAAYYDLSDPESAAAFLREEEALQKAGVLPWLEAPDVSVKALRKVRWPGRAIWLPEASGLSLELAHWPALKGKLDAAIGKLPLSGDEGRRVAERALWLATQWPRLGAPRWLLAPGHMGGHVAATVAALLDSSVLHVATPPPSQAPWWSGLLPRDMREKSRANAFRNWLGKASRGVSSDLPDGSISSP